MQTDSERAESDGADAAAEPTAQGVPRRRLRVALQLLNLGAAALLVLLFAVYCVEKRKGPIYGWVKDTPVEGVCQTLGRLIWRQRDALEQELRDSPLLPEEQARAAAVENRVLAMRPRHAVGLTDGQVFFGAIKQLDEDAYVVQHYDGKRFDSLKVSKSDIRFRRAVVFPDVELRAADYRFLFRFEQYNPYFIPPYVIASPGSYASAHAQYLHLSALADQFRVVFAPALAESDNQHVHVCICADEGAFLAVAAQRARTDLLSAAGFYSEAENCLYLIDRGDDRAVLVVRHEGAHQLAAAHGLFAAFSRVPLWLAEGVAQYCESSPFGGDDVERLALLRAAARAGSLLSWGALLRADNDEALFTADETKALAYAQAWALVRLLMADRHRAAFMRYLLAPEDIAGTDPVSALGNALGVPGSRLQAEVEAVFSSPASP
jgi:hypothetical protein